MLRAKAIKLLFVLFLISSCGPHKGTILPFPNGGWFIRSEGATWGILIPAINMETYLEKRWIDGKHLYLLLSHGQGFNLSMWMEPLEGYCDLSVECAIRQKVEDLTVKGYQNIKTYKYDNYAIVEYYLKNWSKELPEVEGLGVGDAVNQQHMNALIFKDGYWTDMHFSATGVKEGKTEIIINAFKTILRSIKVVE